MQNDDDYFLLSEEVGGRVMQFLKDIVASNELSGGMHAISTANDKEMETQPTKLESGSHETVPYHLIEEVVDEREDSLIIGAEKRGFVSVYAALKKKHEQFFDWHITS